MHLTDNSHYVMTVRSEMAHMTIWAAVSVAIRALQVPAIAICAHGLRLARASKYGHFGKNSPCEYQMTNNRHSVYVLTLCLWRICRIYRDIVYMSRMSDLSNVIVYYACRNDVCTMHSMTVDIDMCIPMMPG